MSHDELIEIQLSALLDGELTRSETVAAIDRMAVDAEARRFWRQARGLEKVLEHARTEDAGDPRWSDIVAAARQPEGSPWRGRLAPALRAAAAIAAVGLGLWLLWGDGLSTRGGGDDAPVLQVVVGSAPDGMDDDRFVALAVELLEAEPRYRQTMLQLLDQVDRERTRREGAAEGPRSLGRAELLLVGDDPDGPASTAGLRY